MLLTTSHTEVLEKINLYISSFDGFSKLQEERNRKDEELTKIENNLNRVIGYEKIITDNYEKMVVLEKQRNPAVEEELPLQAELSHSLITSELGFRTIW